MLYRSVTPGVTYRWLPVNVERVIAYIDGYNFYYGLREARLHSSRRLEHRGTRRGSHYVLPGSIAAGQ